MREIKFRAWDSLNKMMYQDFVVVEDVGFGAQCRTGGPSSRRFTAVMQYTGLHDKHGKEIYEGDILRSRENDEVWRVDDFVPLHRHDYVTNIGYFSGKKYHLRENPAGRYSQSDNLNDWLSWPEMYEIIGNIYENPELLKP